MTPRDMGEVRPRCQALADPAAGDGSAGQKALEAEVMSLDNL